MAASVVLGCDMASSELQQPETVITFPPNNLQLISLLRERKHTGVPLGYSFIHEVDVYSAAPVDLVNGRDHAPGTDQGDGKAKRWYFISPATCHDSTSGGSNGKRQRAVRGATVEGCCLWRTEALKKKVFDADGNIVGYVRTLYYGSKINNSASFKRLGWCMMEFELKGQDKDEDENGAGAGAGAGADQLVLCKVYKSPRKDQETSAGAPIEKRSLRDDKKMVPAGVGDAVDLDAAGLIKVEDGRHGRAEAAAEAGGLELLVQTARLCARGPSLHESLLTPASCDNQLHHVTETGTVDHTLCLMYGRESSTLCSQGVQFPSAPAAIVVKDYEALGESSRDREKAVVMTFDGSSIPSADRIKAVADLVLSFPGKPVIVLAAMGKTTTNIHLAAEKALSCGTREPCEIHEFGVIKDLHLRTVHELGLENSIVSGSLNDLEQLLRSVAMTKELTSTTQDRLVFLGECMSRRIFSAYLNTQEGRARQEWESRVFTNTGESSDLTATSIARDMGLREIQVWKDVDGVLTCDPKVCANVISVPYLTFDEVAELAYFGAQVLHPQSMQLAQEGDVAVIVKNSYNPRAPGTMITKTRDMSKSTVTNILLKSNITMLDIEMLDQPDFLVKGLDNIVEQLQKNAVVNLLQHTSIICLIGNIQMSSFILEKVFSVVKKTEVNVKMVWQGASKVLKVFLAVDDSEANRCVQALHSEFFENGFSSQVHAAEMDPSAAASSVFKRKADDGHPEAPPGLRQERMDTDSSALEDIEQTLFSDNDQMTVGDDNGDGDRAGYFAGILEEVGDNTNDGGDLAEFFAGIPLDDVVYNLGDGEHPFGFMPGDLEVPESLSPGGVDNSGYPFEFAPGMDMGVDDGRYMAARGALQVDDYRTLVRVDDDVPDMLQAEAQQQGLAEAAEEYSGFRTEEELIGTLPVERNIDEFLGVFSGEMSCLVPAFASSESQLHVAEECQTVYCGLCVTEQMGIYR